MSANKAEFSEEEKKLLRRYLIWCYKTTKEELDKVDRYFTQLKADYHVLAQLLLHRDLKNKECGELYSRKIDDFLKYIESKERRVVPQKFSDLKKKQLQPDYWYLKNRLAAVEETIICFLGRKELKMIQTFYEEEMTRRIWEARDHS